MFTKSVVLLLLIATPPSVCAIDETAYDPRIPVRETYSTDPLLSGYISVGNPATDVIGTDARVAMLPIETGVAFPLKKTEKVLLRPHSSKTRSLFWWSIPDKSTTHMATGTFLFALDAPKTRFALDKADWIWNAVVLEIPFPIFHEHRRIKWAANMEIGFPTGWTESGGNSGNTTVAVAYESSYVGLATSKMIEKVGNTKPQFGADKTTRRPMSKTILLTNELIVPAGLELKVYVAIAIQNGALGTYLRLNSPGYFKLLVPPEMVDTCKQKVGICYTAAR